MLKYREYDGVLWLCSYYAVGSISTGYMVSGIDRIIWIMN